MMLAGFGHQPMLSSRRLFLFIKLLHKVGILQHEYSLAVGLEKRTGPAPPVHGYTHVAVWKQSIAGQW